MIPAAIIPAHDPLLARATPRMRDAAQAFEAQALAQLLGPIFATVDTSKTFMGGGAGESTWQPMLVDAMAKRIAGAGGLGLAQPVLREMIRMQANREAQP